MYGLKQVERLWNKTITKFFQKIAFNSTNVDVYILTINWEGELIIIDVYVDNHIFESQSQEVLKWLKDQLIKEFSMNNLREAKTIIG